jgi:hypothetical protein
LRFRRRVRHGITSAPATNSIMGSHPAIKQAWRRPSATSPGRSAGAGRCWPWQPPLHRVSVVHGERDRSTPLQTADMARDSIGWLRRSQRALAGRKARRCSWPHNTASWMR